MFGEIISIGDELLIGQVVNTNASYIAEKLNGTGIRIIRISTIADEGEQIKKALDEASERADIVIMTGGLGPTRDDITKTVLCEYFQTRLIYNEEAFANMVRLFGGRGLTWNKLNKGQAMIPENCTVLPNVNGTAPGMWFEKAGKIFVSLPGVPFEMKPLIEDVVIPKIIGTVPRLQAAVHHTVYTQGIPESSLATKIEQWELNLPGHMKLAYLPRAGMVRLRISALGNSKIELEKQIQEELDKLHQILPGEVFGEGKENLEHVIGKLLLLKKSSLSTAESCTGGYIAHLITSVAGSSDYYKGSIISYANEIKENLLAVDNKLLMEHGAVSEPVVKAMAAGVKKKLNTQYSIAVTGIAGPGGGTDEKPVGTVWIAIGTPEKIIAKKYLFGVNRERNIERTAFTALNMLRKELNS